MKKIHLIVVIFTVVAILLAMYRFLQKPSKIDRFEEQDKLKVMLFHASWCPHCVTYLAKRVFPDKLEASLKANNINGVKLESFEYDSNKALAERFGVNSFPSIVAVNASGKQTPFKGNRESVDELVAFIKKALP